MRPKKVGPAAIFGVDDNFTYQKKVIYHDFCYPCVVSQKHYGAALSASEEILVEYAAGAPKNSPR
ncbi:hypothetical protein DSO57_1031820 [Entomophthora muscae]|uniref:Uncharacterized protein n=1 Tax=Entomophthora muscae TaxID=34485 RepID=A0ACC2ULU1_9FUNG|nr:hypothetical protein DSO57_1031820 [Entomophthora muscae]